jgi:hypothetical protein
MMNCDLRLLILFTQEGTQCDGEYENALSAASWKRHPSQLFPFLVGRLHLGSPRVCVCVFVIARRTRAPP